jgi:hypothetical protein
MSFKINFFKNRLALKWVASSGVSLTATVHGMVGLGRWY